MPGLLGRDERGGDWQDSAFLSLRVFADDGRVLHCRLMPGLTIGSDEACTFHVPGEGVLPVHATVEDEGAVFSIRCKDGASLVLPDGTWMEYLRLCDGVRFKVGRADVHCSRWAYDAQPPPRKAEPMEPPAPAQASAEPIKVLCDRCGADLAKLPEPARFCPRCGRAREPFAAASVPVRGPMGECLSQDPTPVDWRAALGLDRATRFVPHDAATQPTSVVLQGYASAMHSLGAKYESGRGADRNEREAVRCYFKAAKLGNEQAHERLADRGIVPRPDATT